MRRPIIVLLVMAPLGHAADASWQQQFSDAETKWRNAAIWTYRMDVKVTCLSCPAGLPESGVLTVNADDSKPLAIENLSPEKAALRSYSSVPELFELIRNWTSKDPEIIELSFDCELGYPRSIYIDPDRGTTDDSLIVGIHNFAVVKRGL